VPKKLYERGPDRKPGRQTMSDEAIAAYVRAANVQIASNPDASKVDHTALRDLTGYMDKRLKVGAAKAGPPPRPK
jgi:hypothetical protein